MQRRAIGTVFVTIAVSDRPVFGIGSPVFGELLHGELYDPEESEPEQREAENGSQYRRYC